VPWFASDEQKGREAEVLADVRALSLDELAADVLERVFGPADDDLTTTMAFGLYKAARSVDLSDEDKPVFAEALQHLQNHGAIAIDGFRKSTGGALFFILTRHGRELLAAGEQRN
jgi:hypothetical protein